MTAPSSSSTATSGDGSGAELQARIVQSRLLDAPKLKAHLEDAPPTVRQSAAPLANWLVEAGVLTLFQARKLLKGSTRGLVLGKFEIRDFLGKGGMGAVYLAWDREHERRCALKLVSPHRHADERVLPRFRREMVVARLLKHPGVADAYEAGAIKDTHYLAMEYVPGPTLYRLVRKQGAVSPFWSAKWMGEIADALDYMHREGVIHRDLKPSNVIITPEGRAKLLDLGLARWYEDDHNEGVVIGERRIVGSFDYIAPEQASNASLADGRSDIYAIGCLMYFTLAGHPPFHQATGVSEKIACHRRAQATPIDRVRPDAPAGLAAVLAKMMAKAPENRFPSAAIVRDVLGRWEEALRTPGKPTAPSPAALPKSEPISADDPILLEVVEDSPADPANDQSRLSIWRRLKRWFKR